MVFSEVVAADTLFR